MRCGECVALQLQWAWSGPAAMCPHGCRAQQTALTVHFRICRALRWDSTGPGTGATASFRLVLHLNQLPAHPHVAVEWSSARMTSCGGTCELIGGGAGGARIKLSEPLLKVGNSTACGLCVGGCCSKERHSCCAHSVPPTAPACHLGRQAAPARQALGMTRCTAAPPLPAPAAAAHAGPQGRAAARNDARGERRI